MLSKYKYKLEKMKEIYQDDYPTMIHDYLVHILNFYAQYPSLASIEILCNLNEFKDDPLNRKRLYDIYERYESSNFIVSKLKDKDIAIIKERYIQELRFLGKEFGSDI